MTFFIRKFRTTPDLVYTAWGQNRSVSRSAAAQLEHPGSAAAGRGDTTRLNRMARCWATFNFASNFGRLQYKDRIAAIGADELKLLAAWMRQPIEYRQRCY